jgi:cytochrome b561
MTTTHSTTGSETNSETRVAPPSVPQWGRLARGFHWGMLLLIAIQIPIGFWMVDVYEVYAETFADDTWVMRTSRLHHTLGFVVLFLVVARMSWRVRNGRPEMPATLRAYQKWLARLTHITLYILLVIYPLSGWASLSAYEGEFPIFFLGWDSMPRVVPQVAADAMFNYEFFAEVHRWCWRIGAGILSLHVFAAAWHQFFVRDNTVRRMWSGH